MLKNINKKIRLNLVVLTFLSFSFGMEMRQDNLIQHQKLSTSQICEKIDNLTRQKEELIYNGNLNDTDILRETQEILGTILNLIGNQFQFHQTDQNFCEYLDDVFFKTQQEILESNSIIDKHNAKVAIHNEQVAQDNRGVAQYNRLVDQKNIGAMNCYQNQRQNEQSPYEKDIAIAIASSLKEEEKRKKDLEDKRKKDLEDENKSKKYIETFLSENIKNLYREGINKFVFFTWSLQNGEDLLADIKKIKQETVEFKQKITIQINLEETNLKFAMLNLDGYLSANERIVSPLKCLSEFLEILLKKINDLSGEISLLNDKNKKEICECNVLITKTKEEDLRVNPQLQKTIKSLLETIVEIHKKILEEAKNI
jgi:hypothetical protein